MERQQPWDDPEWSAGARPGTGLVTHEDEEQEPGRPGPTPVVPRQRTYAETGADADTD